MNGSALATKPRDWKEVLDLKAKILHQQIASLQRWVEQAGGGEEMLEQLSAPYYEMLRSIYEEDFPRVAGGRKYQSESSSEPVTSSLKESIELGKLDGQQVRWEPKGLNLLTKWPFTIGSEVRFSFDHEGKRRSCEGVVVACRNLSSSTGHYETVLYFVEEPKPKARKTVKSPSKHGHKVK